MPAEEKCQDGLKAPLFPSEECIVVKASSILLILFNVYYIINLMLKKKSCHVSTKSILFLICITMYEGWKLRDT